MPRSLQLNLWPEASIVILQIESLDFFPRFFYKFTFFKCVSKCKLCEALRCANPSLSTDGITDSTEVELSLSAPFKTCSGKIMKTNTKHNSLFLVAFVFRIICKNTDYCLRKDSHAFNKMLGIYFIKETATFCGYFQIIYESSELPSWCVCQNTAASWYPGTWH